jgi:hypothetical protein
MEAVVSWAGLTSESERDRVGVAALPRSYPSWRTYLNNQTTKAKFCSLCGGMGSNLLSWLG